MKEIASEITVTIKDDERTHKTKHLIYNQYTVNEDDPLIKELIAKALQEFNGEPTDVKLRINLTIL